MTAAERPYAPLAGRVPLDGDVPLDGRLPLDGGVPLHGGVAITGEAMVLGTTTLAGVERSVAQARRFAREVLGRSYPALDEVELGVSELATNAIKHTPSGAGGKMTIRLTTLGDMIRVEVTNDGSAMAAKPHACGDIDAEDGRGLLIIEALAAAWGVTGNAGTTTVWAEFEAAHA